MSSGTHLAVHDLLPQRHSAYCGLVDDGVQSVIELANELRKCREQQQRVLMISSVADHHENAQDADSFDTAHRVVSSEATADTHDM